MKWRRLLYGLFIALVLAALAVLIPGSPVYLPELLVSTTAYDGRSARSWAEDLENPDAKVRSDAALALGAIGEPAAKFVPDLAKLMVNDPEVSVRASSSLALTKMGPATKDVVTELSQALSDEQILVRMNAALTLQRLGTDARPAIPALITALKDEKNATYADLFLFTVQEVVALVLGSASAGTDEGVAPLMEALRTAQTQTLRRAIVRAFGRIGPPAAPAIPQLLELRNDKGKALREAVEESLLLIGNGQAPAAGPAK